MHQGIDGPDARTTASDAHHVQRHEADSPGQPTNPAHFAPGVRALERQWFMNERAILYFALRGLSEREATLFKSFVRIIDHRTLHRWIWNDASADLLVMHEELAHVPAEASKAVLHIGHHPRRAPPGCGYLAIPFRADELQECLDRLGHRLMQRKHRGAEERDHRMTAAPWLIQLRRWPPQRLLTGPQQLRLAALIAGQPMTFASLCKHSGLARETCASFVRGLSEAGLLQPPQAIAQPRSPAAARPAAADDGMLARIRSRLEQLVGVRR